MKILRALLSCEASLNLNDATIKHVDGDGANVCDCPEVELHARWHEGGKNRIVFKKETLVCEFQCLRKMIIQTHTRQIVSLKEAAVVVGATKISFVPSPL